MTREEYIHYFNHMEEENKKISLGGMAWDDIAYMIHNAIYVDKIFTEEEFSKLFPLFS